MSDLNSFLAQFLDEDDDLCEVDGWLNTAIPELNFAVGGAVDRGMPVGRVIEIFGPPASGKTFLATQIMIAAQKAGGVAGFSDHERSFQLKLAENLGLDVNSKFLRLKPRTFEESVNKACRFAQQIREESKIPKNAPLVWVFDSVASMVPAEKLYDDKGNFRGVAGGDKKGHNMRDKLALATCCSQAYPQLVQFAEDYGMTILMLNQIRTDPGVMFGNPNKTPGGKSHEYYASVRLSIGKKDIPEKSSEKDFGGFRITAKTVKNKVYRPGLEASWVVKYDERGSLYVDLHETYLDYLIEKGLVEMATTQSVMWNGEKKRKTLLLQELRDAGEESLEMLKDMMYNVENV